MKQINFHTVLIQCYTYTNTLYRKVSFINIWKTYWMMISKHSILSSTLSYSNHSARQRIPRWFHNDRWVVQPDLFAVWILCRGWKRAEIEMWGITYYIPHIYSHTFIILLVWYTCAYVIIIHASNFIWFYFDYTVEVKEESFIVSVWLD